jgi:hypothetical protein
MKFLICPAAQDLIDFCDPEDFFYSPSGVACNFEVEFFEDDMIRISDTVGRSMPIDINDLPSFIQILTRIDNFTQDKKDMKAILLSQLMYGASE